MKHTAVISYERATCSCGQMPGVWRALGETVGRFTLRAHDAWEQHRDSAISDPAFDLFDYRKAVEPVEEAQRGLFS